MSGFLMVPINENGVVIDPDIAGIAANAMSPDLRLDDLFIYSHGWSTDASGAMALYNRFAIEFMHWLSLDANLPGAALLRRTAGVLSVGIHWPSELTEDGGNVPKVFADILGAVQPLTFYSMEKRADAVGTHGVYAVLRQLVSNWQPRTYPTAITAPPSLRINMIGHSFGCKVITSAIEAIYQDLSDGSLVAPSAGLHFNVVLIQGAFENTALDPEQCYGDLAKMSLRMLVTTSQKDSALTHAFPLANKLVNFFGTAVAAMGAAGPTGVTSGAFGGVVANSKLSVLPGFSVATSAAAESRLVTADLTPLHAANPAGDSAWGGHHSDFNHTEVYALVAGFLFGPHSP